MVFGKIAEKFIILNDERVVRALLLFVSNEYASKTKIKVLMPCDYVIDKSISYCGDRKIADRTCTGENEMKEHTLNSNYTRKWTLHTLRAHAHT